MAAKSGHDFDKWIADQCYFFIRDIGHQHQHHAPQVDTILTLQKRDEEERSWRQYLLFSLHYYVISARRTRYPPALMQALGVLAYCRAFVGICERTRCEPPQLPEFEMDAIEASLQARIDEEAYREAVAERGGVKVWNTRLTLIAILAPLLALVGVFVQPRIGTADGIKRFPGLNQASDVLSGHFIAILGLIILVLVAGWSLTSLYPALRQTRSGRDVLRVGLVYDRAAALVSAIIGIAAVGLGAYFGWDALNELLKPVWSLTAGLLH